MDLWILVALLVGASRGLGFQDYPLIAGEEYHREFPLDDADDNSYTSEAEETNRSLEEGADPFTMGDASFPFVDEAAEPPEKSAVEPDLAGKPKSGDLPVYYHHPRISPTAAEVTSEKLFLDNLSKLHGNMYTSEEDTLESEDPQPNAPLIRRGVDNWEGTEEFLEGESNPWNYDNFYPHAAKYPQNEFYDYSNLQGDSYELKNGTIIELAQMENNPHAEPPRYYQKNYYYNYYPLVNSRKHGGPRKWNGEEETQLGFANSLRSASQNRRHKDNLIKKSSCKQYLEFLKYAFERLDESPEYSYEYGEDYVDAKAPWSEKAEPKPPRTFATHLLGPTLYIDNSGKISQVNYKGNSQQSVKGLSSVQRVLTTEGLAAKGFQSASPTTSTTEMPTTLPSTFHHTLDHPFRKTTTIPPFETPRGDFFSTRFRPDEHPRMHPEYYHPTTREPTTSWEDFGQTNFDDYDYRERTTTVDDQGAYKLAGGQERTTERDLATNEIFSKTTLRFGQVRDRMTTPPPFISYRHGEDVQPESRTAVPHEAHRKEDVDCNDKMLPCPDTVNVTYPLNGYCNRYVSCESGKAIRRTCPDGLHFNIITKGCDLPHNSFCTYVCPESHGYYGIPGDCGGYFICKNSVPEYRMCPPRMHWDVSKKICTFAELSSCPMKCGYENEVKPYEGDCNAYVICLNGVSYYHKCPPKAKFDRKSLTCVPESFSRCVDDPNLLTKTLNPNHLCRDFQAKLGLEVWCNYFASGGRKANEWPSKK